jgi:hypothetical protein
MNIRWTDNVRNEELLQNVKEDKIILHRVKNRLTFLVTHCVGTAL